MVYSVEAMMNRTYIAELLHLFRFICFKRRLRRVCVCVPSVREITKTGRRVVTKITDHYKL